MVVEPLSKGLFFTQMDKARDAGNVSENAIKRFWDWAYADEDGAVQTCAFPVPTDNYSRHEIGNGKWIHARSYDEFKDFCSTHSGMWRYHVYSGVNTLNEIPDGGRGKAKHISSVNHLSFDIETKRESYSGATKQEVWWCYKYALAQAKFMHEQYSVWPMIVMSENGIHMHYKVNFKTKEDLMNGKSHVYSKYITKQSMQSEYAKKVENNSPADVEFDQDDVSDVPRVMKVPGTRGIKSKSGRLCGIIHQPTLEQAGVIEPQDVTVPDDAFDDESDESANSNSGSMNVKVTPDDASVGVMNRVKSLCKKDERFRKLYYGNTSGYKSRSEAEMGFAMKMLNHGFEPDEMNEIFWSSGMSKWDEESDNYRKRTIEKAVQGFDGETTKDSTNGTFSFSRQG